MRLSDDRIQFISGTMADRLLADKMIRFDGPRISLITLLARTIINDLKIEDEINAEVERMIASMQRNIPRGSAEWTTIFMQKKEELARRRNYIL